jgi:DNA gyrase/topoisomerase IV subunit A
MVSVFNVCVDLCDEKSREFYIISNQSPNNSMIKLNKNQELNQRKINKYTPYSVSNEIIINTNNESMKNFNSNNYSGNDNELINKMSKMLESLKSKNKILEKEKNEINEEKEKLQKELQICKNKTLIKKINSIKSSENISQRNSYANIGEKIKLIFIFKKDKNKSININESKEELFAYKNEMFIEVKLRLINKRHFEPRYIKMCYYNSKEINDWFTLEELNIQNNSYIICDIT